MNPNNIPLSLYVHIPWCIRKCPYCDFNSHTTEKIPEQSYVEQLVKDLEKEVEYARDRKLTSIFFGGGTPSLFSGESIGKIIEAAESLIGFNSNIEITMETNPGTIEYKSMGQYKNAGVNRISFGVQSFNDQHLKTLGRIHQSTEVISAFEKARKAGFDNINLDLMHGLPSQNVEQALSDLTQAIELKPEHISWYQLTIEPNTIFFSKPPQLPEDERLADIQDAGEKLLATHNFQHYEISAFSLAGKQSVHNLNYWQFGDYLAIGAGAHGKISSDDGKIYRYWKSKQPNNYINALSKTADSKEILPEELTLEFMMNALRLTNGVNKELLFDRTGISFNSIEQTLQSLANQNLLQVDDRIAPTTLGRRFLNELLQHF